MPVTQSGSNAQATFGTYNDIQNTTTGSFNTIINGVAGMSPKLSQVLKMGRD
jgi:hypothetical protein